MRKPEEVTLSQKLFVLFLLVVQNAATVTLTRYSRGVIHETYLPSSVVLVVEICKFILSCFCINFKAGNSSLNSQPWSLYKKLWYLIQNSSYSWVPAVCYFLQNMLQYTALQNLPAPVYAVLQQLKILSAAICSYLILREQLAPRQWRALILLMAGGILIENHTFEMHAAGDPSLTHNDPMKGTLAILTIVALSGLAGVFTQLLLKNKTSSGGSIMELSVWDRNAQLAFWSMLIGIMSLLLDYRWISENGHIFSYWTMNTWILVFLWTSGGILVALTIKYTDVIIKGFASAISLIVISILGWMVLGDILDLVFGIGAIVTILATFNYSDKDPVSTGSMIKITGHDTNSRSGKNLSDTEGNEEDDVVYIDPKDTEKQPLK